MEDFRRVTLLRLTQTEELGTHGVLIDCGGSGKWLDPDKGILLNLGQPTK